MTQGAHGELLPYGNDGDPITGGGTTATPPQAGSVPTASMGMMYMDVGCVQAFQPLLHPKGFVSLTRVPKTVVAPQPNFHTTTATGARRQASRRIRFECPSAAVSS